MREQADYLDYSIARVGTVSEVKINETKTSSEAGVWWTEYAKSYDEFVVPLTCYQENINHLLNFLENTDIPKNPKICDLGAGTGIYIQAMAERLPNTRFIHLDNNREMCNYANNRYNNIGLDVEILNQSANEASFQNGALDVVTSINVIYALPNPKETLRDIFKWLKPGGYFFTIDFGRRQNSLDWAQYFFRDLVRREGIIKTARSLSAALNLFQRQNEGVAAQDAGNYWLHTGDEFQSALESTGFSVLRNEVCYRGYADLAVCLKPTT